jgi:hypothetical protein
VVATSLCQSVGRYPPPHGISTIEWRILTCPSENERG